MYRPRRSKKALVLPPLASPDITCETTAMATHRATTARTTARTMPPALSEHLLQT